MDKYSAIKMLLDYDSLIYKPYDVEKYDECCQIIKMIIDIPIDELVFSIKLFDFQEIDSKNIPMYSNFDDCTYNICLILDSIEEDGVTFVELGKLLLGYDAKDMAFYKYGETHAKAATLLGLCCICKMNNITKVRLSNLGNYYLNNENFRLSLMVKMILHLKLTRNILKMSENGNVSVEETLDCLSYKTKLRRMPNIKRLFNELYEYPDYDFAHLLNTIDFSIKKEGDFYGV